ncbi:MAG: class I SAM-dependent methyltransferase [Aquabacterium sp.]|nr:class I SAM-dependent methyltransferase [Aquabacterium sp.]
MEQHTLYTITGAQSRRASYAESMRVELDVGQDISLDDIARNRINRKPILDYKARILGNKSAAGGYSDWLDPFIKQYGPRKRCLSLGSGLGRVESYLIEQGFTTAIDAIEVCASVNSEGRINEKGVDFMPGDLNFLDIQPDSYDFILCHGVLHHLINLELVLHRINRALRPDGVLLIYEYVGEDRWQFSDQRLSVLKKAFPNVAFTVPPLWAVPGFESVRSSDLLPLVRSVFSSVCKQEVLYGGAYFPFVTCTPDKYDDLLPEVVRLDEACARDGTLAPCYLMGVYGKAQETQLAAHPWSDEQLDARLAPKTPAAVRVKRTLKRTAIWRALRSIKRRLA